MATRCHSVAAHSTTAKQRRPHVPSHDGSYAPLRGRTAGRPGGSKSDPEQEFSRHFYLEEFLEWFINSIPWLPSEGGFTNVQ